MKKLFFCLLFTALLAGCAGEETMETLGDVWDVPAMAVPRQILVDLPEDAAASVLESDAGCIYMGEDYEILLETMEAGDLDGTLRKLCGKGKEELTVLEREQEGLKRYEFVWAAAGETGEQLAFTNVIFQNMDYEVIDQNEKFAYIKVTLETGRTHQIRVHMAYIGHPVAGDNIY